MTDPLLRLSHSFEWSPHDLIPHFKVPSPSTITEAVKFRHEFWRGHSNRTIPLLGVLQRIADYRDGWWEETENRKTEVVNVYYLCRHENLHFLKRTIYLPISVHIILTWPLPFFQGGAYDWPVRDSCGRDEPFFLLMGHACLWCLWLCQSVDVSF